MRQLHLLCCSAVLLSFVCTAAARPPTGNDTLAAAFEGEHLAKKAPSIFHRPAKDSPAEQLDYANRLSLEGHAGGAMKQYRALVHAWHESQEAVAAQQAYAELLLGAGKHERAFKEYQYLIDFFSGEFELASALEQQFRLANMTQAARRGRFFMLPGVRGTDRSLKLYEKIVSNGPSWSRAPEAQFRIGLIQEDRKEFERAIGAYEMLILRYPRSPYVSTSRFRRAYCSHRVAKVSPRDEQRCRLALSQLIVFMDGYPNDENATEAALLAEELKTRLASMYFERADYYDRIAKRPRSAIIAYSDFNRKFPKSDRRHWVDGRIAALEMQVADEGGPE